LALLVHLLDKVLIHITDLSKRPTYLRVEGTHDLVESSVDNVEVLLLTRDRLDFHGRGAEVILLRSVTFGAALPFMG